jgi:hypothetical protein
MARTIDKFAVTLRRILKTRGLEGRLHEYRILGVWGRAVGPAIARHAEPRDFRGGKLSLVVDSPAWMQQLSLLKPELIEKLNSELGRETVRDLALKLGELELRGSGLDEEKPVQTALRDEDREKIGQYVQAIADDNIREALTRLFEKDVMNRKRRVR